MSTRRPRVAVIGGSISGVAISLALAGRGFEVEILERDAPSDLAGHDSMERWWRRGTPQARHSHACLALARRVLLARAPHVWAALLDAGAREMPSGGQLAPDGEWVAVSDDTELMGLACRRPLLEAVLRQCAREEAGVTFRERSAVTGLLTTGTEIPTVHGVATSTGDVAADVVIDASGRASGLLGWLRAAGARQPAESADSCGIVYFSRFYRFRERPAVVLNRGVASGTIGPSSACVAIPGDHDTFSVTLGVPPGDRELRAVGREDVFAHAAALHQFVAPWLEEGIAEPISQVAAMAGLQNRLRRFVVDGRPITRGLLPVGDAVCITDPAFGRGMSLALAHAFALADVVADGVRDLGHMALAADDLTDQLLRPWFEDAVFQDRQRTALWNGEAIAPPVDQVGMGDVMAAAMEDPYVWRSVMRRFNLLDPPDALFRDEAVLAAARRAKEAGAPSGPLSPTRDELIRTTVDQQPLVDAR